MPENPPGWTDVVLLQFGTRDQSAGDILVIDTVNGKQLFEGTLRQCVHCQFTWTYQPGSGQRRGFCRRCNGHLCGKRACLANCYHYEQRVEDIENIALGNRKAIEAAVRRQSWIESMFG